MDARVAASLSTATERAEQSRDSLATALGLAIVVCSPAHRGRIEGLMRQQDAVLADLIDFKDQVVDQ